MSNDLILKINMCYKGVSREFEKFMRCRGKWISYPLPEGYEPFYRSCSGRITMY
jgi:hypothetical protein